MLQYEPISRNNFKTRYLLAGAFDPDEVHEDEIDHMYNVWWNFSEGMHVESSQELLDMSDGSTVDYMYMWAEYVAQCSSAMQELDVNAVRAMWAKNLVELTHQQVDALIIMAITTLSIELKNTKKQLEKYGEGH